MIHAATALALLAATASAAAAADPTAPLDLSAAGLKAVIQAPAGAKATEEFGSVVVRKPPHFSVEISQKDIARFRQDVVANTAQKLKAFSVDTPDTLVYETTFIANHLFHFVTAVKVGAKAYTCEDKKDADNDYTKADVDAMLAACKSLAAK